MGKEAIIASLISTPEGRRKLAESMAQPRTRCIVCGQPYGDFVAHCDSQGDQAHLAASVMET
jgi:hypothetical protein